MTRLQAGFVGDADDNFAGIAADCRVRFWHQYAQQVVVKQRLLFGRIRGNQRLRSRGLGSHAIAGRQRYAFGVAVLRLVGECAIALCVEISEYLCCRREGDQAGDQQPQPHGLCTRCTVNVTVGLC